MTGLILIDGDVITKHQLLATSLDDEKELLAKTAKLLDSCNHIITFNGRMFDIPFLKKRSRKYDINMPNVFNLDLFILLKFYSDVSKILPRMNQKTIEEYAGIASFRNDMISGEESVKQYLKYLENNSKELEDTILLHNSDDIMQLMRLCSLIKNVDVHRAFYKTGFPIVGGRITGIEIKKSEIIVKGNSYSATDYITFPTIETPYLFQMSGKDHSFELTLSCESTGNNVYVDVKTLLDPKAREVLSTLPSFVNDYIILKENKRLNYLDINLLAREAARIALERI